MSTPDPGAVLAARGDGARYEVLAVRYGTLRSAKRELFHRYEAYGEPDVEVEMAYYFWVLRSPGQTILIDTGFDTAVGERRGRTVVRAPLDALADVGVDPADVSTVVITHLHYDHIGNLGAFAGASLIVPRREFEFWTGPLARRPQFAAHVETGEIAVLEDADRAGRVRLTDGVEEIAEGVVAICVGGHSPGQQVTVIPAESGGDVVLASDAVHFYEEYELDRPFGVIANLGEMYEAFDLLRSLAAAPGAVMVPGHDPAVLERFARLDANAVRLG